MRNASHPFTVLRAFPLLPRDARLTKNHGQQLDADVAPMRIGHRQDDIPSRHELMLAAAERARESESSQPCDQVASFRRRPWWHQLARSTWTVARPRAGMRRPRATRTNSQASITSASSVRQPSHRGRGGDNSAKARNRGADEAAVHGLIPRPPQCGRDVVRDHSVIVTPLRSNSAGAGWRATTSS